MGEEEKEDRGFRVSDRRRFSVSDEGGVQQKPGAEGGVGQEVKQGTKEVPRGGDAGGHGAGGAQAQAPRETRERERTALPEINFSTFIVSLSSSVLIHLGAAPDPVSGETKKDLPLAKQTIDILGMLKEKTRGNLTEDETRLLDSLLYDLRMRFVAESG